MSWCTFDKIVQLAHCKVYRNCCGFCRSIAEAQDYSWLRKAGPLEESEDEEDSSSEDEEVEAAKGQESGPVKGSGSHRMQDYYQDVSF